MYNNQTVVDVHGHMTTPAVFRQFLAETVSQNTAGRKLDLSDEQLENAQQRHLKFMDDRNIDVQLIGPRPIAMWHWMRPFLQEYWAYVTNNVIARIVKLHPDRFRGMAQLPQSRDKDTRNCLGEFERCVKELGFVGAYLNPDPAGDKQTPGVHEEYWFPLYEKAVQLDVPLMIHPSITYDRRLEVIPANYQMNNYLEEFVAMQLYMHGKVFDDLSQAEGRGLPLRRRTPPFYRHRPSRRPGRLQQQPFLRFLRLRRPLSRSRNQTTRHRSDSLRHGIARLRRRSSSGDRQTLG